jgi:hypothetical protein
MTLPIEVLPGCFTERQSLEKLLSGLHVKLLNRLGQGSQAQSNLALC